MVYNICRSLLRMIYALLFRLEASGTENIPATGPVVLCSNHISNFDPPTVGVKVRRKVHYMAKAELFNIPLFGPLIRAVWRISCQTRGRQQRGHSHLRSVC